jgi:hypothetical protein
MATELEDLKYKFENVTSLYFQGSVRIFLKVKHVIALINP